MMGNFEAVARYKIGITALHINNGGYFLLPFIYGEGGDLLDTEAGRACTDQDPVTPAKKIGLQEGDTIAVLEL